MARVCPTLSDQRNNEEEANIAFAEQNDWSHDDGGDIALAVSTEDNEIVDENEYFEIFDESDSTIHASTEDIKIDENKIMDECDDFGDDESEEFDLFPVEDIVYSERNNDVLLALEECSLEERQPMNAVDESIVDERMVEELAVDNVILSDNDRILIDHESINETISEDSSDVALISSTEAKNNASNDSEWCIDSGASNHMTFDIELLSNVVCNKNPSRLASVTTRLTRISAHAFVVVTFLSHKQDRSRHAFT